VDNYLKINKLYNFYFMCPACCNQQNENGSMQFRLKNFANPSTKRFEQDKRNNWLPSSIASMASSVAIKGQAHVMIGPNKCKNKLNKLKLPNDYQVQTGYFTVFVWITEAICYSLKH